MDNGVKTGFGSEQPYDYLEKVASGWREHDRLDVVLLRALCRLSLAQVDRVADGFTSQELAESVGQLRGRTWSSPDDTDRMSDDVRRYWNRLVETWEMKREGLAQGLLDDGFRVVPELCKTEGGGSGRPSKYRVDWAPLADGSTVSVPDGKTEPSKPTEGRIRYICEDLEDPGPVARLFARGYNMTGWRRWLMLAVVGLPMLVVYLMLVLMVFGIALRETIGVHAAVNSLLGFIVVLAVTWHTIGPLLNVVTDKIVLAPWWLQPTDNDRLLEFRAEPRYPTRSFKAVRYTATCSICGGAVSAKSGRLEFLGRIVGRCENAPREHVFSFDHVTRRGKSLR